MSDLAKWERWSRDAAQDWLCVDSLDGNLAKNSTLHLTDRLLNKTMTTATYETAIIDLTSSEPAPTDLAPFNVMEVQELEEEEGDAQLKDGTWCGSGKDKDYNTCVAKYFAETNGIREKL